MKIKILIAFVSIILLFSVCSCGNNRNAEYGEIKELLKTVDYSTFDNQGYQISFSQNYSMSSQHDDENEESSYSIIHEGSGSLTILLDETGIDKDPESLLEYNKGYINCTKKEMYLCESSELNKTTNESKRETVYYVSDQDYKLKYDGSNCLIASTINYEDKANAKNSYDTSFAGKISKELMDNAVVFDNLNRITVELLTIEGHYASGMTQAYAEQIFQDAKSLSDQELNDFIKNREIVLEKTESTTIIHFTIDCKSVLKSFYELDSDTEKNVVGQMEIDTASGKLISFQYDLKQLLFDTIDLMEGNDTKTITINNYLVTGERVETPIDSITIDASFNEYEDPALFINDIANKVFVEQAN